MFIVNFKKKESNHGKKIRNDVCYNSHENTKINQPVTQMFL